MTATGGSALFVMLLVAAGAAWMVAALLSQPWRAAHRRALLRARPFPAQWRKILRRRVPIAARLPSDLQRRLKRHIQVFVAEKPFIGCQGQEITDEVRVTIAAQACLLLTGQERPDYYPRLRQVLVYPDAFVVDRERPVGTGLVRGQRLVMAGESWSQGMVILSWPEVLSGAADAGDGRNVVLHEFAHQIDQDKGSADGQPWRTHQGARRRWEAVMGAAFERLRAHPSNVIDAYGASDPAEFFAVVSEVFFERPYELATEAPEVYRELVDLFGLNPLQW